MTLAPVLTPAATAYRGEITDPDRWVAFRPRRGDVIVATPAKSGTTWTQSIVAMLLKGTTDLPGRLTDLSPWIDANFFDATDQLARLDAQSGRRVIKTHTPVDGFPVWEGVKVISVFRHPVEMVLSLRKHLQNFKKMDVSDHPLMAPISDALRFFMTSPEDIADFDRDTILSIVRHFDRAALSGRLPDHMVLNYAAMLRDHSGTVKNLNTFLGTGHGAEFLTAVTDATAFAQMKKNASDFAPEAGRGFWHEEKNFFAEGRSGAWQDQFSPDDIADYDAQFAKVLPNAAHRRWIETGEGPVPSAQGPEG